MVNTFLTARNSLLYYLNRVKSWIRDVENGLDICVEWIVGNLKRCNVLVIDATFPR